MPRTPRMAQQILMQKTPFLKCLKSTLRDAKRDLAQAKKRKAFGEAHWNDARQATLAELIRCIESCDYDVQPPSKKK